MRVARTHLHPAIATIRTTRRRIARLNRRSSASRSGDSIDRALRVIDETPRVRVHLVEAAVARLAAGRRPSSEAIADMAIRRATCDQPR
jgi:hypothetical protein